MNIHIQNEPKITRVLFTTNHVDMASYPNEWAQEIVKRVNEYEGRELAIKALDEENDQLVKQVDDLQKENEQLNDKVIEIGELAFKVIENISKENVKLQEQNRELTELLQTIRNDLAKYHYVTDNTMSKLIDSVDVEGVE